MTEREMMLTTLLGCDRIDLYTDKPKLTDAQETRLKEMQYRRSSGEPLQYVLGTAPFLNVLLQVDPRVLIPRPETELIVDFILKKLHLKVSSRSISILDCGTGSGNIPIFFAKNLCHASLVALDISSDAIDCAKNNASLNGVAQNIEFITQDMVEGLIDFKKQKKRFDCIVSNPPYIKTDDLKTLPKDVQYEPMLALDGGADGCDCYRGIFKHACDCLKKDGFLICEIGESQGEQLKLLAKNMMGDCQVTVQQDLCARDRFIVISF